MSELKNVPELRFSGFHKAWNTIMFGDIYSFSPTNSLSRASLNDSAGEFKNIHYGDIHTKFSTMLDAKTTAIPYVSNLDDLSVAHSKSFCEVGDLIFADASEDYADVGKAVQVTSLPNEPLISGLHTFLAKDLKKQTAIGFSGYLMSSYTVRKQIMIMAVGAKVLGISKTNLAKAILNIPSLEEQQKIADFLSSVEKKIEQLTEKHRLLTEYKKGVMQQIFSQQIRFKDDNGNEYPEWELGTLGNISKRKTVKNKDESINQVLTNSATQGIVSQTDYFDKDIANQNNLGGYYIVDTNDFVYNPRISVSAPVGPIKRNHLGKGVMSPLYTVFEITRGAQTFFERYFDTNLWHRYMNQIANFGARHDRMNVTTADFYNMPMPFPCIEEQQKIANFLTEIDKKIDQAWSILEQTKTFKKGLLQKMFV